MKKFKALLVARNKEFYRDKGTLLWAIIFPFIAVIGFAFAFSGKPQEQYKIAVAGQADIPFLKLDYVKYVPVDQLEPAIEKVKRHQFDMLFQEEQGSYRYWTNSSSPKGYFLERLVPQNAVKVQVDGQEARYVDWLVPGILAMNMMFSALFGVGYTLVRYRKNGVLKRFKATPLSALEFLSAQIVSRLLVIQALGVLVYLGCHSLVHFQMRGSYLDLFLYFGLGGICMISLSTVIAARIQSEELAEGILNVMTWPMMLFSGVWFSLEGVNPTLQKLAQILPLTHIVDGARAIMLDGATLTTLMPHVMLLGGLSVVFLAIGSLLFKWN